MKHCNDICMGNCKFDIIFCYDLHTSVLSIAPHQRVRKWLRQSRFRRLMDSPLKVGGGGGVKYTVAYLSHGQQKSYLQYYFYANKCNGFTCVNLSFKNLIKKIIFVSIKSKHCIKRRGRLGIFEYSTGIFQGRLELDSN